MFSIRGDKPENIFHEISLNGNFQADYIVKDGITYLIAWSIGGSGGYLDFKIYSYDGAGQATRVFSLPFGFPGGNLYVKDHKNLYIKRGEQRYSIENIEGKFQITPYKSNPIPPYGTHTLEIVKKNNQFRVLFDGKTQSFDSDLKTFFPIIVRQTDKIILISQDEEAEYFRMHYSGNIKVINDFFAIILAEKEGQAQISLDLNIHLPIMIVNTNSHIPIELTNHGPFTEPPISLVR